MCWRLDHCFLLFDLGSGLYLLPLIVRLAFVQCPAQFSEDSCDDQTWQEGGTTLSSIAPSLWLLKMDFKKLQSPLLDLMDLEQWLVVAAKIVGLKLMGMNQADNTRTLFRATQQKTRHFPDGSTKTIYEVFMPKSNWRLIWSSLWV